MSSWRRMALAKSGTVWVPLSMPGWVTSCSWAEHTTLTPSTSPVERAKCSDVGGGGPAADGADSDDPDTQPRFRHC